MRLLEEDTEMDEGRGVCVGVSSEVVEEVLDHGLLDSICGERGAS